ncbi:MAG: MlaA family lipoprotein [Sulfitobacter sp.]
MFRTLLSGAAALSLVACAQTAPGPDALHDPYEAQNRKVHAFNKKLAGAGGSGGGIARTVPPEIQDTVQNISNTLSMPKVAANSLLQGDLHGTGIATTRFLVNATFGIAGIADVAGEFGMEEHDTDFGETLHVWGFGEGPYVELPGLGPSTIRDTAGRVADLFTDPLSSVLSEREAYQKATLHLGAKLAKNSRRSDTIDQVLNDSADSYAQARLIYLQKRRYELSGKDSEVLDYDDPYAQ